MCIMIVGGENPYLLKKYQLINGDLIVFYCKLQSYLGKSKGVKINANIM